MREYVVTIGGKQHTVTRRADGKFVMPPELAWIEGHSIALKPAFEPITLARKPLSEGTVAANVLRWGTGALNIDGCRIEGTGNKTFLNRSRDGRTDQYRTGTASGQVATDIGRWPANVLHDGSDEVVGAFPEAKSAGSAAKPGVKGTGAGVTYMAKKPQGRVYPGDSGSAARFFYCAKATKADRAGSKHPTVKPVSLIAWLCRLITPTGGMVLDLFAGSGTTGAAALAEGFRALLIEREAEYLADIYRRLALPALPHVEAPSIIPAPPVPAPALLVLPPPPY